jgi:hypothetical protein
VRLTCYLAAAFLICGSSLSFGMGSGPHPNVPYGLPSPASADAPSSTLPGGEGIWLLLSILSPAVLVWILRSTRKA